MEVCGLFLYMLVIMRKCELNNGRNCGPEACNGAPSGFWEGISMLLGNHKRNLGGDLDLRPVVKVFRILLL